MDLSATGADTATPLRDIICFKISAKHPMLFIWEYPPPQGHHVPTKVFPLGGGGGVEIKEDPQAALEANL